MEKSGAQHAGTFVMPAGASSTAGVLVDCVYNLISQSAANAYSTANLTRSRTLAASMLGSCGGAGTPPPKEHVRADVLAAPGTSI